MAEFGLGGLWAIVLTVLLWRIVLSDHTVTEPPGPVPPAEQSSSRIKLTFRSPELHHALRLGVATMVAVYKHLHLDHGYWLAMTALIILKSERFETHRRARERIAGSVIGGMLAVLLARFIQNVVVLDLLLLLLCVLAYSNLRRAYGLYVFFLTPFVVLMLNTITPGNWSIALVRVGYTLAGVLLAVTVATVLQMKASQKP